MLRSTAYKAEKEAMSIVSSTSRDRWVVFAVSVMNKDLNNLSPIGESMSFRRPDGSPVCKINNYPLLQDETLSDFAEVRS